MYPFLLCAQVGGTSASLVPPSGTVLWSDLSVTGLGQDFRTAVEIPHTGDILIIVNSTVARMNAATSTVLWRLPLSTTAVCNMWSLHLTATGAAAGNNLVAMVWCTSNYHNISVVAFDPSSPTVAPEPLWSRDVRTGDLPQTTVSGNALLVSCSVSYVGVVATAWRITDGHLLFNLTVVPDVSNSECGKHDSKKKCLAFPKGCFWDTGERGCYAVDWFAAAVALVDSGSSRSADVDTGAQQTAIIST
jgi:hypothetical protein